MVRFKKETIEYLRSSLFGFEDALVSTTGVVIGINTGVHDKRFILLASFVTIAVEALSMGAGQFLTQETVQEIEHKQKNRIDKGKPWLGAVIMFISYFIGGIIPVTPFILLNFPLSLIGSGLFAFTGLFTLGFIKGKFVSINPLKSALRMLTIGGLATVVGIVVGYLLRF